MGLPMFREPEEIAADEAAAKLDQIAATRRSRIRRESSVRPSRLSSSRSLIDRIRETRREAENESRANPVSPPLPRRDLTREAYNLDAELERLRTLRQRNRARASQTEREYARRGDNDYIRPEPEPRSDLDSELLGRLRAHSASVGLDDLNTDFGIEVLLTGSPESISQHLPRPSRESGLRFEVAAASQSESEQPRRGRYLPSTRSTRVSSPSGSRRPPWSLSVQRLGSADLEDDQLENARLTPGFAPAQGPFRAGPRTLRRSAVNTPDGPLSTPPPDTLEASYPPLRRVNHLSPRPMGVSGPRVDGLGDRLRSPSPASDGPVEENWSQLLTTMEPGRSSTATSFLSSRSDSRSGSNRSSQATTAATSFGEIAGDDSCDLDLPSGITEEDVREIRARHGRLRVELPPRPEGVVQEMMQRDFGTVQQDPSRGNERLLELEVFSVILERMQRREDIPDEWWAAVGLSPDVVRGSA